MCGIAGFWHRKSIEPDAAVRIGEAMAQQIAYRGPDDSGVWLDSTASVVFAHRRLSIVDLSQAGHQPMISPSGRFTITFNGEIYNHTELRRELEGRLASERISWRGHSDTETLLAGFDQWGVENTVKKSIGMFAFAVWDRKDRILYLARDRMGEKPLYYGHQGDAFLFGSEIKAIRTHPEFRGEIDRDSLAVFTRHNYIPAPYSIYKGIYKLLPGTILTIRLRDHAQAALPPAIPYWSLDEAVTAGMHEPFAGSESEAISALESLLKSAVSMQMMADVPLGAFLSSGIDSSTVVALMQSQSSRPVKTFTIGFWEKQYNEADKAGAIAKHLGTEHTELYVQPDDAKNAIPLLPEMYDEPFADSSQIPTFLVAKLARQHVTVSLSGDAGDELFGGYPRYFLAQKIWSKLSSVPALGRQLSSDLIRMIPAAFWNTLGSVVRTDLPGIRPGRPLSGRAINAAELLSSRTPDELYLRLQSYWRQPTDVVLGASEPLTIFGRRDEWPRMSDFNSTMMYLDTLTYLPDDILVKVDRASMAVSLESRVPFLDHRVVEFTWKLPATYKIRGEEGKWILRQILYKYVPKELVLGPKIGFGVPIDEWLRGPLRDWAESLLSEDRLRREGFFEPGPIREKWQQHVSGQTDWQSHIWGFLTFESWLQCQAAPPQSASLMPSVCTTS